MRRSIESVYWRGRRFVEPLGIIALGLVALACDGPSASGMDAGTIRRDGGVVDLPDGRVDLPDGGVERDAGPVPPPPPQVDGWIDLESFLVPSDGSRSFGAPMSNGSNDTRDTGTRILFFDADSGDQATAEVYFWDGTRIVDTTGSPTNPDNGEAYGEHPLEPNLTAIRPFRELVSDDPVRTHGSNFDSLSGGFPDWFLFRRGQVHTRLEATFAGGRSAEEPMVVAAYGPLDELRPRMEPDGSGPFRVCPCGADNPISYHVIFASLDIGANFDALSLHDASYATRTEDPPSVYFEDCRFTNGPTGGRITYAPEHMTMRRSVVGFSYDADAHNQGYYTAGDLNVVTFDEVVFYKNGYKTNPRTEADPRRDIFSRNFYQGGGARMGHTYRNVISADGASGGPQMRFGGLCENSLIIEGYWFSATNSNSTQNPWTTIQEGQSAVVRNNVQLVFDYPTPNDPDTDGVSDERAQTGSGYMMGASTFGAVVEGNVITGAMLSDELGVASPSGNGILISPGADTYPDGNQHTQLNNTIRNNILYRIGGLRLEGTWDGVSGLVVEDNVVAGPWFINGGSGVSADMLTVRNNHFYGDSTLPSGAFVGSGNTVGAADGAATSEGWPDPDRTLRRYVTEVLGLTLLDWADDPMLDAGQRAAREAAGEEYDPTGVKTFMAVATNMRRGGAQAIPSSGTPSWIGDYPWDTRFTAVAVVNWIRAGFGLAPVD